MTSEGERPKVEGAEPTPSEEAKLTPPQEKPTVGVTETEEFRHELDKALGKSTESINRQLSLQKAAADSAKAEAEAAKANIGSLEANLQELQKQYDGLAEQQFADDPDALKAYKDRRTIADEKAVVTKAKAEAEKKLYEAEKLAWSVGMARRADELVKETGIDAKELEACQTEEEMEVKALRFKLTKEPEKKAEEVEEPKFDAGISSGGSDLSSLSPTGKIERGLMKQAKSK